MHLSKRAAIVWAVLAFLALAAAKTVGANQAQRQLVYLPFVAKNPLPTSTATRSATRTPSPTSPPLFSGVAQIVQSHNWMDGWGWPPGAQVTADVTAPDGSPVDRLSFTAGVDGRLPQATFHTKPQEGDWVTLTINGLQAEFPIQLPRAVGHPLDNTVDGTALPYARIWAVACHGGCRALETDADAEGRFFLDFSSVLDWDAGDHVRVGQYTSANGLVEVVAGAAEFPVITPTPTLPPNITATPIPPFAGIAVVYPEGDSIGGWGWPASVPVTIEVQSPDGTEGEVLNVTASVTGDLPFTNFSAEIREGDRVTITANNRSTSFPVSKPVATADSASNTIEGTARPYARVVAWLEHPVGTYWNMEKVAGSDGRFLFDFSAQVDWVYGDKLSVGQYLNANAIVLASFDSPELWIEPPSCDTCWFKDESFRLQSAVEDGARSVAGDLDRDGDIDLILGCSRVVPSARYGQQASVLILDNDGQGHFRDVTGERFYGQPIYAAARNLAIADFTGDGWLDVVIATEDWYKSPRDRILVNQGKGYFRDETDARFPDSSWVFSHGVCLGDVDNDGDVDIFYTFRGPAGLLINDGHGYFVSAPDRMPELPRWDQPGCTFCDSDRDGDLDLFLTANRMVRRHRLLINDSAGRFTSAPEAFVPEKPGSDDDEAMTAKAADFNGDGYVDIVTANLSFGQVLIDNDNGPMLNQLLINNGNGSFHDATKDLPHSFGGGITWEVAVADIDGDGDLDIVPANESPPAGLVYLNDGRGRFIEAINGVLPDPVYPLIQLQVLIFDMDGDGDEDIVFTNVYGHQVYRSLLAERRARFSPQ